MKFCLLSSWLTVGLAITPPRHPHQPTGNGDKLLSYNETTPSAKLRPSTFSVDWLSGGADGDYITRAKNGDLVRENIATGNSSVYLPKDKIPKDMREYWIGPGGKRVLFSSNATSQYRHSYFSDYYILNTDKGELTPLVDDQVGDIQYAVMSPAGNGDEIAFVRGNDIYLRDADGKVERITKTGSPDMFNGVPDWVYEEEVFGDRFTLWFSPDGKYIAYLAFDETGVKTYRIPYYMDDQKVAPTYPRELALRYPKVGSVNPTVQLHLLEVESRKSKELDIEGFGKESIVGEVAWATKKHDKLVYRVYNRVQDKDKHVTVSIESGSSKITRQRDATDGWLENTLSIQYVGGFKGSCNRTFYVDTDDSTGWMHIYLFPVDGGKEIALTKGDWEVRSILKVDTDRQLIYYTAAEQHSTESHVYSVSYRTRKITRLVDDAPAMWTASFSSGAGYYILSYQGPDVPYQELYTANNTAKPVKTLEDNAEFYKKINQYNLPNITYFELQHPDGFSLNVKQILPPNFDPSKKYPVLFNPYGGPNSQSVTKAWTSLGWQMYIPSERELQFVVYIVDNRGTGLKGRKFRSAVAGQLGKLEAEDQVWAMKELQKKNSFLNPDHAGMWGWSFGGYLTSKTVETDSGAFTFGLITAPVTDWRFYDSVYTERYMKDLKSNEAGYNQTAVRKTAGFKNIPGGVALMHGTGDDNVHYQNSAAFIDLLVGEGVSPSKVKMFAFTDSTHSIAYNNAPTFLYKFLTSRLWDETQRKGPALVHQWSKKAVAV